MKLFIANLNFKTTESDLRDLFSPYGIIVDSNIALDKETRKSRGFAFVTFEDLPSGLRAIEELNDSECQGRKLVVKEATEKSK